MLKEKEGELLFAGGRAGSHTKIHVCTYPGGKNSGTVVLHNNNIIGTSNNEACSFP